MELPPPQRDRGPAPAACRRDARSVRASAPRSRGSYGYRYVETPTFERTELFARTSGGDLATS